MKKLDMASWKRKEIYDFMTSLSDPFYSVSFNIDVTKVYGYAHEKGLSFYYALIYLATKAINKVPAFHNDIKGGELVVLDRRSPSFCDLRPDSEAFYIVSMLADGDLDCFCESARVHSLAAKTFYPTDAPEGEAWIYFSCLPWMDVTCVTNERDFDADDTVPRISWGRYTDRDGRKTLNLSIEVNHRFIDGFHIGQFAKRLEEEIAALE